MRISSVAFTMGLTLMISVGGCVPHADISDSASRPVVSDGVIDLSGTAGPVPLFGSWAFWPGRFVDPRSTPDGAARFERFPASWTSYGSDTLSPYGIGSYALRVVGLDPSRAYAITLPGYSSAVRLFVDGIEVDRHGSPAESGDGETVVWDTSVTDLPLGGARETTLVLHISNFHDRFPASTVPMLIGPAEAVRARAALTRVSMIIPFGAILAMGAYFIALYAFHRKEHPCLWLGLLCVVFALRIVCYDEFILADIIPIVPALVMFRIGYLTFALAVVCFVGFVRTLYPSVTSHIATRVVMAGAAAYALLNLFAPIRLFTDLLVPFQVFTLASALYIVVVVAVAAARRLEGAILFCAGFAVFFAIIFRDILIANRAMDGLFLSHYGILGIIFAMGLIEVRHFTGTFNTLDAATRTLKQTNDALARFVPNDFLRYLGRESIADVNLGDNILKDMCVMFVHLGIDAPMQEAEERLNLLEAFNETLQHVNPIILEHDGFVDKYLTEGVMALFPDDPCRVIHCALEIGRAVAAYNDRTAAAGRPPIRFAAGIHRGSLMLGTIGEAERMDGTVISDVVNMASRLERYAVERGLSVLVSADTAARIGPESPCSLSSLGEVRLRGKERAVTVFEAVLV